ncbi:hypothetical protein AADZ90_012345 [Aestuariibius sp. 2305UL40-4]|uniref:hypothetical protein n=1 Tax=Aestuariibius violaceus TaxID=3234132 RepID=UPI00345ED9E0
MTPGIGHNQGPTMEAGYGWRRHAWGKARAALLPKLPVEVLRLRIRRAEELGLPYKTYAGIRASTGRDVIGFLFSTNALRLIRAGDVLPEDREAKLVALRACARIAAAQPGFPLAELPVPPLDHGFAAPSFAESWSAMRDRIAAPLREAGLPADGVVIVGETAMEREWVAAARAAGFLAADRYFGAA